MNSYFYIGMQFFTLDVKRNSEWLYREQVCASTSLNIFGMAIGVKYIEEAFDTEAKVNVDVMVDNLRVAFKQLLAEADWMDNATKVAAECKVNAMRQFMAYPDWLFNRTRLEQEFAGVRWNYVSL